VTLQNLTFQYYHHDLYNGTLFFWFYISKYGHNIVTWGQKWQPLLGNGQVNTFPWQQIGTQQWRNCWKQCFLCSPCWGYIVTAIMPMVSGVCVCVCVCVCGGPVSEWVPTHVTPSRRGVTSSSQTPPLIEEGAPLLNIYMSRREQKSWSWILMGHETKNYCVGKGQQQFNWPTDQRAISSQLWLRSRKAVQRVETESCEVVASQQQCKYGSRRISTVGKRCQVKTSEDYNRLRLSVCHSEKKSAWISESVSPIHPITNPNPVSNH
jgi:hypothetical protein